jgi:hypothetical protein
MPRRSATFSSAFRQRRPLVALAVLATLMLGSGLSAARELAPDEVPSVLPIPYVVGPELFRVYTDARLFRVRIIINGHAGHVANDGGDGAWRDDEIGVDVVGPLGYPNELNINGFLVPGKNQIVSLSGSTATWRRRRSAPGWERSTGASRSAISTIRSASRSRR